MAVPRRELKITYGSYVLGAGQARRQQTGPILINDDPDQFLARFELQIAGCAAPGQANDLATEIAAAKAAFTNPDQELKVELVDPDDVDSVLGTLLSAKPTTPSRNALFVRPRMSLIPRHEGNTSQSTLWEVEISGRRTPGYDAGGLRQDFEYTVEATASQRRTLSVRGTYGATASTDARAQYLAEILGEVALIQTALGGDWGVDGSGNPHPVSTRDTTSKLDEETSFELRFKELLYNENLGALDDPDVVDQELEFGPDVVGNASSDRTARPFKLISGTFRAWIDKDAKVGLSDLQAKWVSKIEPWLRQNIRSAAQVSTVAVMSMQPSYDPANNVISARFQALASGGSDLVSRRVVTTDRLSTNAIVRDFWPEGGDRNSPTTADAAVVYYPAKTIIRAVVTETEQIGHVPAATLSGANAAGGGGPGFIGVGLNAPPLRLDFGGNAFGIFGVQDLKLEFGAGGGRPGGAGGGGQSVPGAGIASGGVLLTQTTEHENRWRGSPPDEFETTVVRVTQVFRIVGAPPAAAGGAGGGTREARPAPPPGTRAP